MWNVKSLEEAYEIISKLKLSLKEETINTLDALTYVLSEDVYSKEDVPAFNKSSVDGYACKYLDIAQASETSPALLKIVGKMEMGSSTDYILQSNEAYYVPTGAFVPNGADTVVMIENTERLKNEVLIYKKSSFNDNYVSKGEDVCSNQLLIKKNTVITPRIIGVLKSQNINNIKVYAKLNITIISTGDEIVDKDEIQLGEVRDINSHTISSFINQSKHIIVKQCIINDNYEAYKNTVDNAIDSDLIIASGGSSVGEKDYTIRILNELNYKNHLHGIHVKPGKPTIISQKENNIFLGLPGHPMSAYIILNLLFNHIISSIYNTEIHELPYITKELSSDTHNNSGRMMIKLVTIDQEKAIPLHTKSALIKSLSEAYGYIVIDSLTEGLYEGDIVKVYKLGD